MGSNKNMSLMLIVLAMISPFLVAATGCDMSSLTPVLESVVSSVVEQAITDAINPEAPTLNNYNLPQTYSPSDPLNNAFDPSTLLNTNDPTNPINGPTSGSGT